MTVRTFAQVAAVGLFWLGAGSMAPASAQIFDGSGLLKFGVFAQGVWTDFDKRPVADAFDADSMRIDGAAFGASFGFDLSPSRTWLIGAEVDVSLGDLETKFDAGRFVSIDYLATLRGRLGYYVHPDWLIYATAGAASLAVSAKDRPFGDKQSKSLVGWTAGVGMERDLYHIAVLFAEYLYADYDSATFNVGTGVFDLDAAEHVFRAGIKFKIGQDFEHDRFRGPAPPFK